MPQEEHIDYLELAAFILTTRSFLKAFGWKNVHIRSKTSYNECHNAFSGGNISTRINAVLVAGLQCYRFTKILRPDDRERIETVIKVIMVLTLSATHRNVRRPDVLAAMFQSSEQVRECGHSRKMWIYLIFTTVQKVINKWIDVAAVGDCDPTRADCTSIPKRL